MNFLENITLRRTQPKAQSKHDSDVATSITLNDTMDSVPEMSDDDSEEVKKLRDQILSITLELQTAKSKIEILTQENNELKQLNETLTKVNCGNDNLSTSYTNTPKTKRATDKKTMKNKKKTIDAKTHSETHLDNHKVTEIQDTQRESTYNNYQARAPKICILSTDNTNNLLDIADNTLKWSKRCHYITPHSSTQQLLRGIKEKLSDFSQEDYCLILIGEEDFKVTKNYVDIVTHIREILQEIKHTNFIICAPTFKVGNFAMLHNWRVETFNNLLYLDIITHEHAYILDSNMNLSYDYHMFNRYNGRINNVGLQTIFKDVNEMICYIQSSNDVLNDLCVSGNSLSDNLFRM